MFGAKLEMIFISTEILSNFFSLLKGIIIWKFCNEKRTELEIHYDIWSQYIKYWPRRLSGSARKGSSGGAIGRSNSVTQN